MGTTSSQAYQSEDKWIAIMFDNITNVEAQIKKFDGFKGDSIYLSIQSKLTKYIEEIEDFEKESEPSMKEFCSQLQTYIVVLHGRLEKIIASNLDSLNNKETGLSINQASSKRLNIPLNEDKKTKYRNFFEYKTKKANNKRKTVRISDETIKKIELELQVIAQIEESLLDIKAKIVSFANIKSDPKYIILHDTLVVYRAKLEDLEPSSEENRRQKLRMIEIIEKNLQALSTIAEENEKKVSITIKKGEGFEEDVLALKMILDSHGFKSEINYLNIDQTIRNLAAKLKEIRSPCTKVEEKKNETINIIENILTMISQNVERYQLKIVQSKEISRAQIIIKDSPFDTKHNSSSNQEKTFNLVHEENSINKNENNLESILITIQNNLISLAKELLKIKRNNTIMETEGEKPKSGTPVDFQSHYLTLEQLSPLLSDLVETLGPNPIDVIERLNKNIDSVNVDIQNATSVDNKELNNKLQQFENELNSIEENLNQVITKSKIEAYKRLLLSYTVLGGKLKKDTEEEILKLNTIVDNLLKVRKEVYSFLGDNENIAFLKIQKELNDLKLSLGDIDCENNETLQNVKKQAHQKINEYLEIMNEKSSKVGDRLINKLIEIGNKLEQFEPNKRDCIKKDLDQAQTMLESIPETEENKDYYRKYLKQLITYFTSKSQLHPNNEGYVNDLMNEVTELDKQKQVSDKTKIISKFNQNLNLIQKGSSQVTCQKNVTVENQKEPFLVTGCKSLKKLMDNKSEMKQYQNQKKQINFEKDFYETRPALNRFSNNEDEYAESWNQIVTHSNNRVLQHSKRKGYVNNFKNQVTELENVLVYNRNTDQMKICSNSNLNVTILEKVSSKVSHQKDFSVENEKETFSATLSKTLIEPTEIKRELEQYEKSKTNFSNDFEEARTLRSSISETENNEEDYAQYWNQLTTYFNNKASQHLTHKRRIKNLRNEVSEVHTILKRNRNRNQQKINSKSRLNLSILEEGSSKVSKDKHLSMENGKEPVLVALGKSLNKREEKKELKQYEKNKNNLEKNFDKTVLKTEENEIDYEQYRNQLTTNFNNKLSQSSNHEEYINDLKNEATELEPLLIGSRNIDQIKICSNSNPNLSLLEVEPSKVSRDKNFSKENEKEPFPLSLNKSFNMHTETKRELEQYKESKNEFEKDFGESRIFQNSILEGEEGENDYAKYRNKLTTYFNSRSPLHLSQEGSEDNLMNEATELYPVLPEHQTTNKMGQNSMVNHDLNILRQGSSNVISQENLPKENKEKSLSIHFNKFFNKFIKTKGKIK